MTQKRISIFLIWSIWLLVVFFTIRANNAPDYHMPYATKKLMASFLPQGWGFFTRNPKEGITEAYGYHKGALSLITVKNASLQNQMGLSRNARFAGIDLIFLLGYVPESAWHKGKGDFRGNLPDKQDTVVVDRSIEYFPEGQYVLHRYEPIPFAWAGKGQDNFRPYLVARIQVIHKEQ